MSARKLWATSFPRIPGEKKRHESKAAAYRYVVDDAARNWLAGALRSQHLMVWVDERDGRGWQRYEDIDLATFGAGDGS